MPEHYIALMVLFLAFAIKWTVKLILLRMHKREKIGHKLVVMLTMVAFGVAYTALHASTPSAETMILMGIFVLLLVKMED